MITSNQMTKNILDETKSIVSKFLGEDELDELFDEAVKIVTQYDRASASLIQRRLSIGYARAARLLDQLESAGVVGSSDGSEPRNVLIKNPEDIKNVSRKEDPKEKEVEYKYSKPKLSIITKPNNNPWKKSLYDLVNDPLYDKLSSYSVPFGYSDKEIINKDLKNVSHISISGNISSQKEVLLDTILTSLISKLSHNELKLILVDTTRYLDYYNGLQHLLTPVIESSDRFVSALRWTLYEMDRRRKMFIEEKVRDIDSFNVAKKGLELPEIVIAVNHFEHNYYYSPVEVGDAISMIISLGKKVGVHLILVTDRMTKKEVPLEAQANILTKIFFRLTHKVDSGKARIAGVDELGLGEAIIISEFDNKPAKFDAVYTSDENIKAIVESVIKSS